MIIPHPLLGPRDASEFIYLGDAALLDRPDPNAYNADALFHDYVHSRENRAGAEHRELWYHEHGDRSWLVVTRNTVTHEITYVELARDVALARGPFNMSRIGDGLIDRSRPLSFSFNGRKYAGYGGDTLASALLANDVRLVGRSFKYHRPRGIFTHGAHEPSDL